MDKSWGLTGKILAREKTIESRWSVSRRKPWGAVKAGDMIFFKNAGEPAKMKAGVRRVMQFDGLTPPRVRQLLRKYGKADGIAPKDQAVFFKRFRSRKYCTLIFLEDPQAVRPFGIDKEGFGSMAAWITVRNIAEIADKRKRRAGEK